MKIFIGSSSENRNFIYDIKEIIKEYMPQCECISWTDYNAFGASEYTLESLIKLSKEVDSAIFIFGGDDRVENNKGKSIKTRDNVLIEYGLFVGSLGRKNVAILYKDDIDMPSDLEAITYITMDMKMPLKLGNWIRNVNISVKDDTNNKEIAVGISKNNKINILKEDVNGYYCSTVIDIRHKTAKSNGKGYTIYKLDGIIDRYSNSLTTGETHWVLYEDGRFSDMLKNDTFKFKYNSDSGVQEYKRGEITRNIYVDDVIKLQ